MSADNPCKYCDEPEGEPHRATCPASPPSPVPAETPDEIPCPTCGTPLTKASVFMARLREKITAPVPPDGLTELGDALDEFGTANQNLRDAELDPKAAEFEAECFQDEIDAARKSVEQLFTRLTEERDRLRKPFPCGVCGGSGKPTSGLPCICGGVGTEMAEMEGLRLQCFEYESELDQMKETALTRGEIAHLEHKVAVNLPAHGCQVCDGILAKLRSGSTTEKK